MVRVFQGVVYSKVFCLNKESRIIFYSLITGELGEVVARSITIKWRNVPVSENSALTHATQKTNVKNLPYIPPLESSENKEPGFCISGNPTFDEWQHFVLVAKNSCRRSS